MNPILRALLEERPYIYVVSPLNKLSPDLKRMLKVQFKEFIHLLDQD